MMGTTDGAPGELVWARQFNSSENPATTGKFRPIVLIERRGGQWIAMGLTTKANYADGTPRVRIADPAAVGLRRPGYLWGEHTTCISVLDVDGHIGWVDLALAEAIIELARLPIQVASTLLESAATHRGGFHTPNAA